MKKSKIKDDFSKILDLEKSDISMLTGSESAKLKGGLTHYPTQDPQQCTSQAPTQCWTDCNCTYSCGCTNTSACYSELCTAGCIPTNGCNPTAFCP